MILIFSLMSCVGKSIKKTNEYLLAGDEYKYWIRLHPSEDPGNANKRISYFDRQFTNLVFWYDTIDNKIHQDKIGDVLYRPYWRFINDSTFDQGGDYCKIITLNDTLLVFESAHAGLLAYKSIPIDSLPINYRKVQEIPKGLRN